jgi:putative membrane protein
MNQIKQILIGIVIGGGMILPGVSGGVLAVIFGIYEGMLEAVGHFFKNVKKNILFLAPLLIGVFLGILIFGKVLYFVFEEYPMEACFIFMGLILGGIPALFKEMEKKGEKKLNVPTFLLSFFASVILFVLGNGVFNIDFSSNLGNKGLAFVLLFLTGVIFAAGKIIPGISSSFMLMLIGMYQFLLNILNNPFGLSTTEYLQLIPFGLGIIVGSILLINFIQYLLKNYYTKTYSIIIGFVIGSLAAIYPGFSFDSHGYIGLLLMIIGFFITYKFTLAGEKGHKSKLSIDK